MSSNKLILYHLPPSRSTRAAYMYHELKSMYGDEVPEMEFRLVDRDTFRTNKPKEFLEINPNGKVRRRLC